LYAYLSKYLVQKVKSIDNVKGCYPDTFKTVMHSNFNWNSISIQKNAPLHLSILSQDPKDYYYDDDYYYPSSAGKDIDVIIVDTDFYFNYKEFKNDNNRITTCKAVFYTNGSIGENNSNINYSSCDVKDKNHGKSVADIVGGVENGVAKRSNIYGIRIEETKKVTANGTKEVLSNALILKILQYIYNTMINSYKTVINLSFGGTYDTINYNNDYLYYNQMS